MKNLIIVILLVFAFNTTIYMDTHNGQLPWDKKNNHQMSYAYSKNIKHKKHVKKYNRTFKNKNANSYNKRSIHPSANNSTTRRLEGAELLHSSARYAYYNYLSYSIKQNIPKTMNIPAEDSLWLLLDIDRNGQVIAYDVYRYSDNEELKNAIITALEKTVPFQPIPDEYKGKTFNAILVFRNGGKDIGQGAIANPPTPTTKIKQGNVTKTLKVTDVKLTSCNGSYPANLSHEMRTYVNKIHKQINANWEPDRTEVNDVRLSYLIDRNGKISNINIGYSKGPDSAINAAKKAILSVKAPSFPETETIKELNLYHYFDVRENKIYH